MHSAGRCLLCSAWIVSSTNIFYSIFVEKQGSFFIATLIMIGFMLLSFAVYIIATSLDVLSLIKISAAILFIGPALSAVAFPEYFNEKVLYILGAGGGVPIGILTKTMEDGSLNMTGKTIRGCLILNIGSRVVIYPMIFPSKDSCDQELSSDKVKRSMMYQGIEVFSESDILRRKGVPRTDGSKSASLGG